MNLPLLRAWWWSQQRLGLPLRPETARATLDETGWVRSVAGVSPYLALFARSGISRAQADHAVAALQIHELPAVRGCTYVVPADDYALALRAGQDFADAPIAMAKKQLGVTEAEVDALCTRVLDVVDDTPLDPAALKDRLGDAVRHLGDAGKKRGTTTTLPLALGRLQSLGELRRVPVNGRLDQQRYGYARWSPSPLLGCTWTDDALSVALAERFWAFAGPARLEEFVAWSGLGVKAARAAVASLGYAPVDAGSPYLASRELADRVRAHVASKEPQLALVGSLDNALHLRRDLDPLLDAGDAAVTMPGEKVALAALGDVAHHLIVDRGRIVGLWDFDPDADELVWATFRAPPPGLDDVVVRTERFVRDELGDARSFSLDAPASRGGRLKALRALRARAK